MWGMMMTDTTELKERIEYAAKHKSGVE